MVTHQAYYVSDGDRRMMTIPMCMKDKPLSLAKGVLMSVDSTQINCPDCMNAGKSV